MSEFWVYVASGIISTGGQDVKNLEEKNQSEKLF
jgi:hypothetical protein